MLRTFFLITPFLLFLSSQASAQRSTLHLLLKDSTEVHGLLLYAGNDAVLVLPNPERFQCYVCTANDTLEALRNAERILYSDVLHCELERSSAHWLIGFPGMMAAGFLLGAAFSPPRTEGELFFGPVFDSIIGGVYGVLIGIPTAIVLHYIFGADWNIDVTDRDDLAALARYSVFKQAPPAEMLGR